MQQFYTTRGKLNLLFCILSFTGFLLLPAGRLAAQNKDSTVTGIYTGFKTYWKSIISSNNTLLPDTSHDLLAFTFRGVTYSTDVNNTVLDTKVGSANYTNQVFRALPVKSIDGTAIFFTA